MDASTWIHTLSSEAVRTTLDEGVYLLHYLLYLLLYLLMYLLYLLLGGCIYHHATHEIIKAIFRRY